MTHMDVGNVDNAGVIICPCATQDLYKPIPGQKKGCT